MTEHVLMTGFATVDGHFVSRRHVVKALEAEGMMVLTRPEKDTKPAAIAVGKLLGGKPTKVLLAADSAGVERRDLAKMLAGQKARSALQKSLADSKDSLDPQELRALEALQSRGPTSKKTRRKKTSTKVA